MRQRIIEALTYPRMVLSDSLGIEDCLHNGFFNAAHRDCIQCEQRQECRWLNCNDEFSVLAKAPLKSLYESLQFCIDCLDAKSTRANHNVRRCACESCEWVRQARRLASQFRDETVASQQSGNLASEPTQETRLDFAVEFD